MKLLYKPFEIVTGVIGAKLGENLFRAVWSKLDDSDPPAATAGDASIGKVIGGAALEAAAVAGSKAAVNNAGARSFHYLFGFWPGGSASKKDAEASS